MVEKPLFLATSRMAEGPKNHWIRYQGFQIAMYNSTTLDTENRLYELELEHTYKMGCCTLLAKSITSFRNQIFFENNPLPKKLSVNVVEKIQAIVSNFVKQSLPRIASSWMFIIKTSWLHRISFGLLCSLSKYYCTLLLKLNCAFPFKMCEVTPWKC